MISDAERKKNSRFYSWCHRYIGPGFRLLRPFWIVGAENLIDGPALVCANHSAMIDPLQIALAFHHSDHLHVFAKAELYKVPVVSWLVRRLGAISVDRSTLDMASVKTALEYLKSGEKVLIFPEGTRMSENDALAAKNGAVKLAERSGVPVIPAFLPRNKRVFKRSPLVFGTPYHIEKTAAKRTQDDYNNLSRELMERIFALDPEVNLSQK